MAQNITIHPAAGTFVVRAGGAVLGETTQALELIEGDRPSVIYIPRSDIAMAFLEATKTTTTCPRKGVASYYSIIAKSGEIADAAWSYEDPLPDIAAIKDYLAFDIDKVAVEAV